MGGRVLFQPLTTIDRLTVILYRIGILFSFLTISFITYISFRNSYDKGLLNLTLILLYISTGLGVFFIHLYMRKLHRLLKISYYISLLTFLLLICMGKGDTVSIILFKPHGALFLLPLSGCIGFITAKEAFCFGLLEGYVIAILMLFLIISSSIAPSLSIVRYGLLLLTCLFFIFTIRKIFMPIHYDIGDKSAYN